MKRASDWFYILLAAAIVVGTVLLSSLVLFVLVHFVIKYW